MKVKEGLVSLIKEGGLAISALLNNLSADYGFPVMWWFAYESYSLRDDLLIHSIVRLFIPQILTEQALSWLL